MSITEFTRKVHMWMLDCFGHEITLDRRERNHRFFEEATELVQSLNMTKEECYQLIEYVYSRPVGVPGQEVGGVSVTFAALCNANAISMELCAEAEYVRIMQPDIMEKIRLKQQGKPKFSPLPQ